MLRTCGVTVAQGGSKCSSKASRRFVSASSSVSPWLATSTSRHWATNQSPSCHTLAVKVCFIHLTPYFTFSPFRLFPFCPLSSPLRASRGEGRVALLWVPRTLYVISSPSDDLP